MGSGVPQLSNKSWQIVETIPELRTQIIDRMVGDPEFRTLCSDYDRCFEALGRFREQAGTLPDRVVEYEDLLADLEQEIRDALNQSRSNHTD